MPRLPKRSPETPKSKGSKPPTGWVPTYQNKADWLSQQYSPDVPEFPLDPEVIAEMPADVPGEVPTSFKQMIRLLEL